MILCLYAVKPHAVGGHVINIFSAVTVVGMNTVKFVVLTLNTPAQLRNN
jgi:hypothetical protein